MKNNTISHSYRGIKTDEKIRVLCNNLSTEIKCVMVQDCSTSILKSKYANVNELEIEHHKQIGDITSRLAPEMIAPPILNNEETITKIEFFNDCLSNIYSNEPSFQLLLLNAIRNISKWSLLYRDIIQLMMIMCFLGNCFRSTACQYPNNLPKSKIVKKN